MRITPSILHHELIGLEAKVVQSPNRSAVGLRGRVVDESRETFTILHEGKEKTVIKETSVLHFSLPDGSLIEIDGRVLVGRPEDRVKRVARRRW